MSRLVASGWFFRVSIRQSWPDQVHLNRKSTTFLMLRLTSGQRRDLEIDWEYFHTCFLVYESRVFPSCTRRELKLPRFGSQSLSKGEDFIYKAVHIYYKASTPK